MFTIRSIRAEPFEVPLRHPFATAQDRLARQVSTPIRIVIALVDGSEETGEAVPVRYVTGETAETVLAAVARISENLVGQTFAEPFSWAEALMQAAPNDPAARAGAEMALVEATARLTGSSPHALYGGKQRTIETDLTIPVGADASQRALEAAALGFRVFKVKVAGDPTVDLERILGVSEAAPGCALRIDANQAFQAEDALRFLDAVLSRGISVEVFEQPTPRDNLEALDHVARRSSVPVFADEAVRTPEEALRVVRGTAVAGINIKLMKSGIGPSLEIVRIAREHGRNLMMGCMLETRRGIGAALAFACGTGAFRYADLDSHLLLAEEGPNRYFREEGPWLSVDSHEPVSGPASSTSIS